MTGYCARYDCGKYRNLDGYLKWCAECLAAWMARRGEVTLLAP